MRPCVPGLVFVARFLIASSVSFPVIGLFSFSIFSVFRHYRLCASMSLCVSYRLTRFWCIIVMAFSLWTYMLNHVQLFATPWAVACQAPLSVGFSRQEYLEWVTMSSSRGSSPPGDRTQVSSVSCIAGRGFLPFEVPRKPLYFCVIS